MAPSRDCKRSRHRASGSIPQAVGGLGDEAGDGELDSYLAALAPDAAHDAADPTGRIGGTQVVQLRLPALRVEQLRRVAAEHGLTAGALAAEWVVDRLTGRTTRPAPFLSSRPPGPGPARCGDSAPAGPEARPQFVALAAALIAAGRWACGEAT